MGVGAQTMLYRGCGEMTVVERRSLAADAMLLQGFSLIVSDTHLRAKTGMRSNKQGYRLRQDRRTLLCATKHIPVSQKPERCGESFRTRSYLWPS